jgi:hypothetical protein
LSASCLQIRSLLQSEFNFFIYSNIRYFYTAADGTAGAGGAAGTGVADGETAPPLLLFGELADPIEDGEFGSTVLFFFFFGLSSVTAFFLRWQTSHKPPIGTSASFLKTARIKHNAATSKFTADSPLARALQPALQAAPKLKIKSSTSSMGSQKPNLLKIKETNTKPAFKETEPFVKLHLSNPKNEIHRNHHSKNPRIAEQGVRMTEKEQENVAYTVMTE